MIAENFHKVEEEIEAAKGRRRPGIGDKGVLLVAVTKNHDIEAMRAAIDAGATTVGENRIQEAVSKYEALDRTVSWHLIGHLQTNKAKQAVRYFDLIHSVDSEHLAKALDQAAGKIGKIQDILIQVNLAKEASKSGVYRENLLALLDTIDKKMANLHILGLMCIAPNYEDVNDCRPLFREMYEIFSKVKEISYKTANIKYLSMGMSHDYKIAVEEGANIVRVGTAIFGARQY